MSPQLHLSALMTLAFLSACGSDDNHSFSQPVADAEPEAALDAGRDSQTDVDAPVSDAPGDSLSESASLDAESDVLVDAEQDAEPDAGPYPKPTLKDISFEVVDDVPAGEYLLFNDWNSSPNTAKVVSLDGQTTIEVFRALRIWSLGVSRGNDRIAFACTDPQQAKNYGVHMGDAIQHTWIYDVAAQKAEVVAFGNINDECHLFGPNDDHLYVCRRYDFTDAPSFKGWRIGRIELDGFGFEFLTPEKDAVYSLQPQPTADESEIYFGQIDVAASPPSGVRTIEKLDIASGALSMVREKADNPVLSPDGSRYLFRNYADGRTLWASSIDGSDSFRVTAAQVTKPIWSPDGSHVAYLVRDDANNCDHIEVVASDGSQASSPFRVRDCASSGEFITALSYLVVQ